MTTPTMPTTPARKVPHPYQVDCGRAVLRAYYVEGINRALMVMPTGCGKSYTFALIARTIRKKDPRPVLFLAHREELLHQAAREFQGVLGSHAIVDIEQGPSVARTSSHVVCASMQTIGREGSDRLAWLAELGPSLVIMDEAHRGSMEGCYEAIGNRFGCLGERRTFLLGCTATPARLDGKPLVAADGSVMFQKLVYSYALQDAISNGYLCDLRGYRVRSHTNLSKVGVVAGEYNQGQLAKAVNDASRTHIAIERWKELASDRITAAFCVSVDHAADTATSWREAGYTAASIDGKMPKDERRDVLRRWRTGEIQVVTSCQLLTEGLDYPAISCIVMLAPTLSWVKYCQSIGRGTRRSEGKKDCIVIDVADNTGRHSLTRPPISLAKAIGLPSDIDLEGGTTTEAREAFDALTAKGLPTPLNARRLQDIKTRIEQIDLFASRPGHSSQIQQEYAESEYAPEVLRNSRLAWRKRGDNEYTLTSPRGGPTFSFRKDPSSGAYTLHWTDEDGTKHRRLCLFGDQAFRMADAIVQVLAGSAANYRLLLRKVESYTAQKGGKEPANTSQERMLLENGVRPGEIARMSKAEAAQRIAEIIGRKATPYVARR